MRRWKLYFTIFVALLAAAVVASVGVQATETTAANAIARYYPVASAPSGTSQCNTVLSGVLYTVTTAATPTLYTVDSAGACINLTPAVTENMRFIPLFHSSNTGSVLITFTPDTAMTVTRISGQTQGTASTCSVAPTVTFVQSGASTSTLTVADSATYETAALTNVYAAAVAIHIQYNGGTCTTAPTNLQFLVQYK